MTETKTSVESGMRTRLRNKNSATAQQSKSEPTMTDLQRTDFYNTISSHPIHDQSCSYNLDFPQHLLLCEISDYRKYGRHPTAQEVEVWAPRAMNRMFKWNKSPYNYRSTQPKPKTRPKPNTTFLNMIKIILQWKRIETHQRKRIGIGPRDEYIGTHLRNCTDKNLRRIGPLLQRTKYNIEFLNCIDENEYTYEEHDTIYNWQNFFNKTSTAYNNDTAHIKSLLKSINYKNLFGHTKHVNPKLKESTEITKDGTTHHRQI